MEVGLKSGVVSYLVKDNGHSKNIVFVHGNSHGKNTFHNQFESELANHFNLYSYDLFGHGGSEFLSNYKMVTMVDQLIQFCQDLALENLYLVGHSLGGHIVIEALKQGLRTEKALCFGTPPLENPLTASPFLDNPKLGHLNLTDITDEQVKELQSAFYTKVPSDSEFELKDLKAVDPKFRDQFLPSVLAGEYDDEIEILAKTDIDVLFLHGVEDSFINLQYIKDKIPSKFSILEVQSGHNIHRENAPSFNEAVAKFFLS